jgi:peptidoglycan hydrolase CwlO-like protein
MRIERQERPVARPTIAVVASLTTIALGLSFAPASASTASHLKRAESQLASLEGQIASAEAQTAALHAELTTMLRRIDATRRAIEEAGARIAVLRADEGNRRAEVDAAQAVLDARAADAYMDPLGSLDVILGATSLQDLQSRLVYVGAVAQSDQALVDDLKGKLAALARDQAQEQTARHGLQASERSLGVQAATLSRGLAQQQALVGRLGTDIANANALVKHLKDTRAREIALANLRREQEQQHKDPPPPSPPPSTGSIDALISQQFAPLGSARMKQALCVGDHESSDNADAVNPSSGAEGVFQFLPDVWPALASAAGYGGRSAFDADANVVTVEWDVSNFGWADWQSDAAACGL